MNESWDSYTTSRLTFSPSDYSALWWAIDEDNVEYGIYPCSSIDPGAQGWTCFAQKREAYNEVKVGLGVYESFEDAAEACDQYDPRDDGLLDSMPRTSINF